MGIRIPDLLEGILEATATEQAAKARISLLRATLEAEGRRRLAEEKAAPSWNAPQLGKVRLDPPGEWAPVVADDQAYGSHVAQQHPTEATAIITIPAADLDDALTALGYVNVNVVESRVAVRPAFTETYLDSLLVDVEETEGEDGTVDRAITVVDPTTGQLVEGLSATRTPARLVVSLDRTRRAAAIDAAKAEATALVESATSEEDGPPVDGEAIRRRRIDLEGMGLEDLKGLARRFELGTSGTKAELAERVARAEAAHPATGREVTLEEVIASTGLRPASEFTASERATVDRFEAAPDALGVDDFRRMRAADPVAAALTGHRPGHRIPYVGEGADGARRSAEIDRTEAEGYDELDPRREECLVSANRWEQQAIELDGHGGVEKLAEENNRETLRRICRAKGLPAGGSKTELAARIVEAGGV